MAIKISLLQTAGVALLSAVVGYGFNQLTHPSAAQQQANQPQTYHELSPQPQSTQRARHDHSKQANSSQNNTQTAAQPQYNEAERSLKYESGAQDLNLPTAIAEQRHNYATYGTAVVTQVLPDDRKGNPHQRFLMRLPSGERLLVAHNIDIAPRVADIKEGDAIEFKGVFESNAKGGVIHWTHKDPDGGHAAGWIKHNGITYQ